MVPREPQLESDLNAINEQAQREKSTPSDTSSQNDTAPPSRSADPAPSSDKPPENHQAIPSEPGPPHHSPQKETFPEMELVQLHQQRQHPEALLTSIRGPPRLHQRTSSPPSEELLTSIRGPPHLHQNSSLPTEEHLTSMSTLLNQSQAAQQNYNAPNPETSSFSTQSNHNKHMIKHSRP